MDIVSIMNLCTGFIVVAIATGICCQAKQSSLTLVFMFAGRRHSGERYQMPNLKHSAFHRPLESNWVQHLK